MNKKDKIRRTVEEFKRVYLGEWIVDPLFTECYNMLKAGDNDKVNLATKNGYFTRKLVREVEYILEKEEL